MAPKNIEFLQIESVLEALGLKQLAVEASPDTELGFRMWGGKDALGIVTRWLAKNKPGLLYSLRLSSLTGASESVAKIDENGNIIRGSLDSSDIPDHNDLDGLQGGTTDQYYHVTLIEKNNLHPPLTLASASGPLALDTQEISFLFGAGLTLQSGALVVDTANISHSALGNLSADDHTQYPRVDGARGFSAPVSGSFPQQQSHLATKEYVDAVTSSGIDFLESVKSIANTVPVGPASGDRYITDTQSGDWSAITLNSVVQYTDDEEWDVTWDPSDPRALGARVYVEDQDQDFRFTGSEWIPIPEVKFHSELLELDADDHTQYSRVDGTRSFTAPVGGVAPTTGSHLTTRSWVESLFTLSSTTRFYLDPLNGNDANSGYAANAAKKTTTAVMEAIKIGSGPRVLHILGFDNVTFDGTQWSSNTLPAPLEVVCEQERIYVTWRNVLANTAPLKFYGGSHVFDASVFNGFLLCTNTATVTCKNDTLFQYGTFIFDTMDFSILTNELSSALRTLNCTFSVTSSNWFSCAEGGTQAQWVATGCNLSLDIDVLQLCDAYSISFDTGSYDIRVKRFNTIGAIVAASVTADTDFNFVIGVIAEQPGDPPPPYLVIGANAGVTVNVSVFVGNQNGRTYMIGNPNGTTNWKITEAGIGNDSKKVLVDSQDTVEEFLFDKLIASGGASISAVTTVPGQRKVVIASKEPGKAAERLFPMSETDSISMDIVTVTPPDDGEFMVQFDLFLKQNSLSSPTVLRFIGASNQSNSGGSKFEVISGYAPSQWLNELKITEMNPSGGTILFKLMIQSGIYSSSTLRVEVANGATSPEATAVWSAASYEIAAPLGRETTFLSDSSSSGSTFDYADFTPQNAPPSDVAGRVYYDNNLKSWIGRNGQGSRLEFGRETWVRCVNLTGSNILHGQVVYIVGSDGSIPTIALAKADVKNTCTMIGMATHDIPHNTSGEVCFGGMTRDLNTSGFSAGQLVFVSPTVEGGLTTTEPVFPYWSARVGRVITAHSTAGIILIVPDTDPQVGSGVPGLTFKESTLSPTSYSSGKGSFSNAYGTQLGTSFYASAGWKPLNARFRLSQGTIDGNVRIGIYNEAGTSLLAQTDVFSGSGDVVLQQSMTSLFANDLVPGTLYHAVICSKANGMLVYGISPGALNTNPRMGFQGQIIMDGSSNCPADISSIIGSASADRAWIELF